MSTKALRCCCCHRSQSLGHGLTQARARSFGWRKTKAGWVCPMPHSRHGNDGPVPAAPAAGAYGNKRKKDMTTRAFKARRARGVRTRVGSRYRDPRNGQFV